MPDPSASSPPASTRRSPSNTEAAPARPMQVIGRPGAASVFDGLRLVDAGGDDADGSGMGVVLDDRSRTVTAVLAVRGHSFALLGPADQDTRVAGWARVLASLARDGSAVHRLQWVETCLPDDGGAVRGHLDDHGVLADDAPAARSYRALLDEASPVTRRHRVLVAPGDGRRLVEQGPVGAGGRCVIGQHPVVVE